MPAALLIGGGLDFDCRGRRFVGDAETSIHG
jgi:hypothetical protein